MKFRPGALVKGSLRSIVDVPAWIGFKWLKGNTIGLFQFARQTITGQFAKTDKTETFEQAMQRQNLSEQDLALRVQALQRDSYIFAGATILSLLYMFYLFWNVHFFAGILTYLVSMLFLSQFAKCRFWLFQIQQRKLGCTITEWLSGKIEENKNV